VIPNKPNGEYTVRLEMEKFQNGEWFRNPNGGNYRGRMMDVSRAHGEEWTLPLPVPNNNWVPK
jgi:hypothetical protein